MTPAPLRLGILGAARIARNFVAGIRGSSTIVATAVASRDVARAHAFAAATGVPRVFDSYETLLADGDVDAIYNPLPNGLHAHWSIIAMAAGKHVLCEKPLAASAAEARAMFDAARRYGVHLAEAFPYRAQPQTHQMQRLIADGAIGTVKTISANFGFLLTSRDDVRLDPAMAGGALMDLGTYPLSLVRMITGENPVTLQAIGELDATGVDRSVLANLHFANGVLAQVACSFDTAVHRQALIAGTHGSLETTYTNHSGPENPAVLRLKRGAGRVDAYETIPVDNVNGFLAEAESFAALVRGGAWNGISERESIDVMTMLDELRALVQVAR
ncbi:MAG: Gfo/Idh/MocA family oxidoreductase [Gemmatimonadota bacterium]